MTGIFADGFSDRPYWWDTTPPRDAAPGPLPETCDVVIIGSGYTGLHAAITAARGGRSVTVLDAGVPGQGCSTRNGGQISQSIKPGLATLTRRHGAEIARAILADGFASRAYVEDFIRTERIDCGFSTVGRFHAAHSRQAFRAMVAAARAQPEGFEQPAHVVTRADQRAEIGSDRYYGGVVFGDHAALDPGRYHSGLLDLATAAGVRIVPHTAATALDEDGLGVTVATTRGEISARDVVLATNGYSGALSRWHQRRVIPIGSYIIATDPVPPALMDDLIPNNRIQSDSRRVVYYWRASPDRRRILFGGRVSAGETDPRRAALRLRAELLRIFPQLETTRISHGWMGFVGYTFDTLAHTGSRGRLHHAMGYCGSGVGMASYLGMKAGLAVLGRQDAGTGLGARAFPTRPLYRGRPWFLPAAVEWNRLLDRLGL